jgi:hypothetical protein
LSARDFAGLQASPSGADDFAAVVLKVKEIFRQEQPRPSEFLSICACRFSKGR